MSKFRIESVVLLIIALFLAGTIFLIDLQVGNYLAIGVLYTIVILYSWLLPGLRTSVWMAFFCSVLVMFGFFSTPDSTSVNSSIGLNTLISLVAIWITTSLVTITKFTFRELENAKNAMEEQVKERTKALEESERNFRLMVENVKDYAIILLNQDGLIVNWNLGAKRLKGYHTKEIVGNSYSEFFTTEERASGKPDKFLKDAIEHSFLYKEGWRVKKDGTKFWAGVSLTPLYDDSGNLSGFSHVARDLSERRTADLAQLDYISKLDEKNRELEQFAYVAAHDLQEPLRTLTTFSNLLGETLKDEKDEEIHTFIDYISKASTRMSELVKGLLDYSRIGSKKNIDHVDTKKILIEVMDDLQEVIKEEGAQIQLVDPFPKLLAYKTELRLLFQNLISNAIKFRKPTSKPIVEISCKEDRFSYTFNVKDDGIGIPKKFQDKIFVIFKRLHNRNEYEGTGIGLAHCQKIVRLHHGRIWVKSEPGHGSTFSFTVKKQIK